MDELPTKTAARDKLQSLLEAANQQPTLTIRFHDLVERWQNAVAITIHEGTRAYYQKMLNAHLVPVFGDREIRSLTKYELELFVAKRAESYSRSTVKGMMVAMSRVLNWACDNEWLVKNPANGVKLPRTCGGRRTERHVLTGEQVFSLSAGLHEPYSTLVVFLAVTGVRIAEALSATWEDVADGKLQVRGTKSAAARRSLPLPEQLIERLRRLGREGLLFKSQSGTALNPGNTLKRYLRPECEKLGIELGGMHDFRHTAVTQLLRSGCDVKVVASYAGHSSTRVTLDVYRHTNTDELRAPMVQLLGNVRKPVAATVTSS
jgi:integrase